MAIKDLKQKLQGLDPNSAKAQKINQRIAYLQRQGGGGKKQGGGGNKILGNANLDTTGGQVKAETNLANYEADQGINYANANQYNPFGSQEVTRNEDGSYDVTQNLSEDQQQILDQDEQLSQSGRDVATNLMGAYDFGQGFNPTLSARPGTGELLQDRSRIEDAVYKRLTGRIDDRRSRDTESLEQNLYNRGVSFQDMHKRPEMAALNERYQDAYDDASGQAVQLGGTEYSRSFGIGEQTRANELAEQSGVRNQQIGEVNNFSQFGTGLQTPNFQGFQGVGYDVPGVGETYANVHGVKQGYQNLNNQRQELGLKAKQINSAINRQTAPDPNAHLVNRPIA